MQTGIEAGPLAPISEQLTPEGDSSLATLIGQDDLCVAVFRLVVSGPQRTVDDLSREMGVSEKEIRDCLDKLADLSMLSLPTGDDVLPVPVHPEVGLAAHIHRREAEIEAQQRELAVARAAAADLAAAYAASQAGRGGRLETLSGMAEVRMRLTELSRHAREELLAFMPGGALSQAALDASRPLDEQSLASGVRLRTVYLDSVRNDRATIEYARWLSTLGGQVRTSPVLPLRMLVVDRACAVLPLDPEESSLGAVVVRAPGVVAALVALFETLWEQSAPLDGRALAGEDVEAPTPQESALLSLLAQGHTDEVAARKLGLSLRTVRRMMAVLTARLGARSRFEAGMLAARVGWI